MLKSSKFELVVGKTAPMSFPISVLRPPVLFPVPVPQERAVFHARFQNREFAKESRMSHARSFRAAIFSELSFEHSERLYEDSTQEQFFQRFDPRGHCELRKLMMPSSVYFLFFLIYPLTFRNVGDRSEYASLDKRKRPIISRINGGLWRDQSAH